MANSLPEDCFTNNSDTYISKNSFLSLKPSDLSLLFNQFNNSSTEQKKKKKKNNTKNVVNSNYHDIDQLQTLKFPEKKKSLSLFHINACSLNKNFDDLQHLLKCTNNVFDIVGVSETRTMKKTSLTSNINLNMNIYSFEFTPGESSAGGTLLYIANHLPYKSYNYFNLHKTNQLESAFIEIINSKKVILLDVFINILLWKLLTLTLFLTNCLKKTSKFFFFVILILIS